MCGNTHQSQGFCDESPNAHEAPDDETAQNRLDLGYTTLFGMRTKLGDQKGGQSCKKDLGKMVSMTVSELVHDRLTENMT